MTTPEFRIVKQGKSLYYIQSYREHFDGIEWVGFLGLTLRHKHSVRWGAIAEYTSLGEAKKALQRFRDSYAPQIVLKY